MVEKKRGALHTQKVPGEYPEGCTGSQAARYKHQTTGLQRLKVLSLPFHPLLSHLPSTHCLVTSPSTHSLVAYPSTHSLVTYGLVNYSSSYLSHFPQHPQRSHLPTTHRLVTSPSTQNLVTPPSTQCLVTYSLVNYSSSYLSHFPWHPYCSHLPSTQILVTPYHCSYPLSLAENHSFHKKYTSGKINEETFKRTEQRDIYLQVKE